MGKNRNRIGIIAAILQAANSGSSKTRIMFEANLSFSVLIKYLNIAEEVGFIRLNESKYHLTELGQVYLKQYEQYEARCAKVQKATESLRGEREGLDKLCEGSISNGLSKMYLNIEELPAIEEAENKTIKPTNKLPGSSRKS